MTDHLNRRSFTRVPLPFPVLVRSGGQLLEAHGIDVSAKGLLAKIEDEISAGLACTIEIELTPERVIQAIGEVVRGSNGLLAVEFSSIDIDSFELIKNLVRYNAEHPEIVEREFDEHLGLLRR